jgi:hypothetical protein
MFAGQKLNQNVFWDVGELLFVADVSEVLADEGRGRLLEEHAVVIRSKPVDPESSYSKVIKSLKSCCYSLIICDVFHFQGIMHYS